MLWKYTRRQLDLKGGLGGKLRNKKTQEKLLYIVPIINEQQSVSFQLQTALEASSGSQLTDAEEKLSDSLTAHTESERETGREKKSLSVHMFIHSLRILFYLPTRSRLWLFRLPPTLLRSLLCHWFAGYYLLVFWTAAGTMAEGNSNLKLMVKKTAWTRMFASTLKRPLFQLSKSKGIQHA